ncbi:MAG: topology modulation protein [Alphaproteobacteria bacterium ADurb.Bin438]|nr:MAG: topology modulation protein [Alphaproteobacteria bacterium ADurb.Bin438]
MLLEDLGSRICIMGPSSSGKSTLTRAIADKKGIEYCHLDSMAHIPNTNWVRCDNDEFIKKHDEFIKKDSWVIDGNYKLTIPQRFDRATAVIFLDFSPLKCCFYYLKRCLFKKNRYGTLEGAKSDFSFELLRYIIFDYSKKIDSYRKLMESKKNIFKIYVKNRKELNELYIKLGISYKDM